MVRFQYTAKTISGEIVKSEIEANDEPQAIKTLRDRKLLILKLNLTEKSSFFSLFSAFSAIGEKDKIIFIKELSVMVQSGLTLTEALDTLKDQTSNNNLNKIIGELSVEIRGGKSLSQALKKYPDVFSPLFINIVNSGEKSGKLDSVLESLSKQMDKDYELKSKIKGAFVYPVVILVALTIVLVIAVVFIIPQIKKIFDDMNVELPILTKILIGISSIILNYWWIIILFVGGLLLFIKSSSKTERFKRLQDVFLLKVPIFGVLIKKIYMAQFSRNLASLISAGVPMLEALKTNRNIINNLVYQEAIDRIMKDVENGVQLSVAIRKEKGFPPMISQLLNAGEKSGKIDFILNTIADFYDREVDDTTHNLTTILEPALTVVMGIAVALFAVSVILPIYGLVNAI